MTTYSITAADGCTATIDADELSTRQDGSAWFLIAVDRPPAKLQVLLILARGWKEIRRSDLELDWTPPVDLAGNPEKSAGWGEQKPPRLLPAIPPG
jgi:hypothetical protein